MLLLMAEMLRIILEMTRMVPITPHLMPYLLQHLYL